MPFLCKRNPPNERRPIIIIIVITTRRICGIAAGFAWVHRIDLLIFFFPSSDSLRFSHGVRVRQELPGIHGSHEFRARIGFAFKIASASPCCGERISDCRWKNVGNHLEILKQQRIRCIIIHPIASTVPVFALCRSSNWFAIHYIILYSVKELLHPIRIEIVERSGGCGIILIWRKDL